MITTSVWRVNWKKEEKREENFNHQKKVPKRKKGNNQERPITKILITLTRKSYENRKGPKVRAINIK